jgi:hypothetical protein
VDIAYGDLAFQHDHHNNVFQGVTLQKDTVEINIVLLCSQGNNRLKGNQEK